MFRLLSTALFVIALNVSTAISGVPPEIAICVEKSIKGVLSGESRPSSLIDIKYLTLRVLGGGWRFNLISGINENEFVTITMLVVADALDAEAVKKRKRFSGTTVLPTRSIPKKKKDFFIILGKVTIPPSSDDMYGGTYSFEARIYSKGRKCVLYSLSVEGLITLRSFTKSLRAVRIHLRKYGIIRNSNDR